MPDGGTRTLIPGDGSLSDNNFSSGIFPDGRSSCNGSSVQSGQTVRLFSTDGSFLRMEVTTDNDADFKNNSWTLYMPDGSRVVNLPSGVSSSQRIYDRNDNYIDILENSSDSSYSNHKTTYIQDQLGRKIVIEYEAATGEDRIHAPGFSGANVATRVLWKDIIVNRTYQRCACSAPSPLPSNHNYNFPLNKTVKSVDKIYLPSQIASGAMHYQFGYSADSTSAQDSGWGEIDHIKLPTDAFADYEYDYGGTDLPERVLLRGVTEKTLTYDLEYDGSSTPTSDVWTYQRTGTDPVTAGQVTAPDGGTTKEYYTGNPNQTYPVQGETYKTENPDGSVVERWYESNALGNPPFQSNGLYKTNRYVKYEFVTIANAAGSLTMTGAKEYTRDKNGNVLKIKEYDYMPPSLVNRNGDGVANGLASGASAYLKRITVSDHYYQTPESSLASFTDSNIYVFSTAPKIKGAVKSAEVQNASGNPQSRSEMYYDNSSAPTNGNLTKTRSWDSTKQATLQAADSNGYKLVSANYIETQAAYDSYGNPTQTTDAKGVQTTFTYGAVNGHSGLYPTQTEAASNYSSLKRTSTAVYDFFTGLVTSATDVDNSLTNTTDYDALGRPTKAVTATGTALEVWTQTVYDDADRRVVVKSDLETKGDARKVATQFFDQLGRVRLSKTLEDAATQSATNETDGVKVQTRYKISGNYTYQLSSNPYRADYSYYAASEQTMGWTRSMTYKDGKHSELETFAGAPLPSPFVTSGNNMASTGKVQTDTDADRTMVTDQAGKKTISKTNALGQMTDVWEIIPTSDSESVSVTFPNQSVAYGYKTSYQYDTLNNLTQIHQPIGSSGGQTRSFSYSSLSRLLSATNPESGTISYVYDSNGNLTKKTDARNIETTYIYDVFNRITNRNYNDSTPDVVYNYSTSPGSIGALIMVDNGFSKTEYTEFDILGRVKKSRQTTGGAEYPEMTYTYNLSGVLIEQKYPSGRVVKNVLDNNGDLETVKSKKSLNAPFWNYARNFTYTAAGSVSSMELGNFRWESTVFNSRLQPVQIALGKTKYAPSTTNPATDILDLDFDYGTSGNNGNVLSQTITIPTVGTSPGFMAVQTYTYDALNRIHDAKEMIGTSETWKQTFKYDRFGNREFDEANTTADLLKFPKSCGTAPNLMMCAADKKIFNPLTNTSDNRLSASYGYTFDDSGNTTKNAQDRKFTYDAENKQTKVETLDTNGNVTGTISEYFYDGDGRRVKKYVPSTGETTVFIYDASGRLVAENSTIIETSNAKVSYLTNDHLGSPRINTDQNGAVTARHDYKPFGEEVETSQRISALGYADDTIRKQFTGYERDNETDLDFAQARYYAKNHGRFTSADPILMKKDRQIDPQRINLYQYARNSPLSVIDPDGMDVQLLNKKARERILDTLPKEIRKQVEKKIDKKGLLKSGVLDKIKSDDANFNDLRTMVNEKGTVEVITATKDDRGEEFWFKSAEEQKAEDKAAGVDVEEEVIRDDGTTGPRVYEDAGYGGKTISAEENKETGNIRVILPDGTGKTATTPKDRAAKNTAHEVYGHAFLQQQGKPWRHDDGGPVNKRIKEIEDRTKAP
ncbi:MAG TPA: RHS repeat-associated core domain-containing protein [Pyrinomonadaceae bacterium]